jgi:glycerol-3-phosphate dehydrogenase (NAD(P)+)
MRIGVFGAGTWGFTLATLLAGNGHQVTLWVREPELFLELKKTYKHPKLAKSAASASIHYVSSIEEVLASNPQLLVESVTSKGIRPVLGRVRELGGLPCPLVLSSKGIEQNTGLLLPEVAVEVLEAGRDSPGIRELIGCISGPSHAEEVILGLPTSVVGTSYSVETMELICDAFTNETFRVYPNPDINGVAFGGAMKNIMAIACGISDGLGLGDSTKAALMTRGLHEIRKLSRVKGCDGETLIGLSGLGDLCVTCLSKHSRNYQFGLRIAEGKGVEQARQEIGMVVEGVYTCMSGYQLGKMAGIPLPITEGVYAILYEGRAPKEVVRALMTRAIKDERL